MMTVTTQLLQFARRAGSERSAVRILAEMSLFIARTFSVYRVAVYLFEGSRLRPLVAEYASGQPDPGLWDAFRSLEGLEATPLVRLLEAGEDAILVKDPNRGDYLPVSIVEPFGMHPFLALALRGNRSLQGIVLIEGEPSVLEELVDSLSELASFVNLAVENARAFARERQRAREAEALIEVSAVLTQHTDLTPVLTSVAMNCARVTGFERASIFLVNDNGSLTPVMSQFADGHADAEAWATFRSGITEVPACRQVLETGEPLVVEDAAKVPDLVTPEWSEPFGLRSTLIVPLAAWGERFGVLVLDHREVRTVAPEQVRFAMGVASHGAAAIGLARLLAGEREAVERMAELDQLKNAFVATVSHELRTPLTTIVGFSRVLHELVNGEAQEFVDLIRRESLHLESLIANLLDSSRLEAGMLSIHRELFDLVPILDEAIELVSHLHPGTEVRCRADGPLRLEGDPARLRQVLVNLLENACKYGSGRVLVQATRWCDQVRVEIEDNGPGIPAGQRTTVFERFQRLHDGHVSGTGVGLYVVRALVEAHHGKVTVEDATELGGARFVVEVPVESPRPENPLLAKAGSAGH